MRDKSGDVLKITDARMEGGHIQAHAANEPGEQVAVESLMIEE